MTNTNDDIFEGLCGLLEPYNTEKIALTRGTDIAADLNIDSVSVMDFVLEVEDKYDIDIPINLLSETRTLEDLAGLVERRIAGS